MTHRVPSARKIDIAHLSKHTICFHKRGWKDRSGKCNAFLTGSPYDGVLGVVYEILQSDKRTLDEREGLGNGYEVKDIQVCSESGEYTAFTYIANETHIDESLSPFTWYRDYVIHGALYHKLPEKYIDVLRAVKAIEDSDRARVEKESGVLRSLYSSGQLFPD
jgi:hypothetical protein